MAKSNSASAAPEIKGVAITTVLVGLIVLATLTGWAFDIRLLKSLHPQLTTMKANTALCLGLTAVALWLSRSVDRREKYFWWVWALLAIVSATAIITLCENVFDWNAGIDELIFRDVEHQNTRYPPGRFAPGTGICLLLLSCALLLLDRFRRVSHGFALATILVTVVALTGYLYNLPTLYGAVRYTSMALHTIAGFFILGVGVLAARPERGLTALLIDSWKQKSTVHTLVAGAIILPFGLGFCALWGQRQGWYGSEFTLALFTVFLIVLSVALMWITGAERQTIEAKGQRIREALLESEERFRTMADNIPNLAWTAHADGNIFWYNRRWYEYTGTTFEEMQGWGWQSVHDPAQLPAVMERWRDAIAAGSPFDMVFPLRGWDGVYRPFLTRIEPIRQNDGRVARWFGTNTDISAERDAQQQLEAASRSLRKSLEEKEVLLKEVHHRVKNNLQIISSLLAMQGTHLNDASAAAALRDSESRVRSMALIHELLYSDEQLSSINFSGYLGQLVPILLESYRKESSIECHLNVGYTELTLEQAIPCGLILNELITNSLKYAYPSGNGDIMVSMKTETGWTEIVVRDNGVGLPSDFDAQTTTTLGFTIVQVLTQQLGGECSFSKAPGLAFTLRFPRTAVDQRTPGI